MRFSRLFSQTLREPPTDAEVASHQLLIRAGYIRSLGAGIFSYLHLARRTMTAIETIMREEINAIGGQEITMPVVQPADGWQASGRWYQIGSEMGRMKDKNGHDMVLAMTHEEVVAALAASEIRSYKQLPVLVYHIQTKWRDDPRPRAGLIRVREFTMLDSYSLDATWEGLEAQYRAHYQAYFNIFNRCDLSVQAVKADTGMMGGKLAHEYMYLTPIGEDTILFCDQCGFSANRQVARFAKPPASAEPYRPLKKIPTLHTSTIDDLARLLAVPTSSTAKAVFMIATMAEGEAKRDVFIFAVVRGDMEVNEFKLIQACRAAGKGMILNLRPATEAEIRAIGAAPGYASPIGLAPAKPDLAALPGGEDAGTGGKAETALPCLVVVDDLIPNSPNLVAGANEEGYHLLNTNYGRDYTADVVADIVNASEGSACPECGGPLKASRGVEVGNIFQLGTRYSPAFGSTFTDENGQSQPVIMGSYGIGVGRLMACIAEASHDERGLVWPVTVAPYPVHIVLLAGKTSAAVETAERVERELREAGIEALYDDRVESPGVKFMDADLTGIPLRLTIGERGLKQGGVEFKRRTSQESFMVPFEAVVQTVKTELAEMRAAISARVVAVEYK